MRIFITQRHSKNIHGDWIDSLENGYISYLESFGLQLMLVPNVTGRVGEMVKVVEPDGIILTGGGDVNPELYGETAANEDAISRERDRLEIGLLRLAIDRNLPVFGICRGMHMINVHFKGRLLQDIKRIDERNLHNTPGPHEVVLDGIPALTQAQVNSYHNHGITENILGKDLVPFAVYPDLKLVEGLYHRVYPIAGIQWHPERHKQRQEIDGILMDAFINRKLFWSVRK